MDHIRDTMQGVPTEIVRRQVAHFYKADPGYGIDVATRMGARRGRSALGAGRRAARQQGAAPFLWALA